MTLALPTPTRPFPAPAWQAEPPFADLHAALPKSRLDLVLDGLKHDHPRHAAGPIFPCPICFDPPLQMAS